ncbi:MAG: lipoprotein signal peptidase [Bacteroidia bacterium]|nr:lipoprotein signal peptidase [Bacteroidia bacterium]
MERWKKIRLPLLTILVVSKGSLIDQFIKIYIKTHFTLGDNYPQAPQGENRAELWFIENKGMAFGYEFGGAYGKIILSLFRVIASVFGVFYIRHIIRKKEHWGYIFCVGLIFAGAVGNIIDCAFYGLIFDASTHDHIATLFPAGGGYGRFLEGEVVDMFHLPFWRGTFPDWFPKWAGGGTDFEFFSPIFNFADFSISMGVFLIFVFQRKFFKKKEEEKTQTPVTENTSEQISASTEIHPGSEIKTPDPEIKTPGNDVPPVVG